MFKILPPALDLFPCKFLLNILKHLANVSDARTLLNNLFSLGTIFSHKTD